MSSLEENPLRLTFRRIGFEWDVVEALPNLFSVRGEPFKYRGVSRGWALEQEVRYFNWDEEVTENAYILEAPGEEGPLTREMVDQCRHAIAEAFPDLDTENLSQAEGLARLLFTGQRDLDGSFILDHLLATVEVVKQLTAGAEEPARTVAIDLAWLHRLPGAGTVAYHRPITEELLRAWGLRFPGLTLRVMLFAMHRTESARELYSRLASDEMTRLVALASVIVSQCGHRDRRKALEEYLAMEQESIRDFHPITGPVLDVLGWEEEHGRGLLDFAITAVDRIGLVAEVSEQLLLSAPKTRETVKMIGSEPQSRPVSDPDGARRAVVSILSIYREAFRELGFDGQYQRDSLKSDRDTASPFEDWWVDFVRSIDPGAAEAFVTHYFGISGFSRQEDFEHFLGQRVARFHRLYSSRPGAIVTCPEVIWVLLAPFTMKGGLVLGSPTHGWFRAGSGFFEVFMSEDYHKSWFVDLSADENTDFGDRWLEHEVLERLENPTVNSCRLVYSRDTGQLRECSLEVHRVFGETWILAQKGKETFFSVTNVADERDNLSGPLMLFQPYPSPSTFFLDGNSGSRVDALHEVVGEALTWLGTDEPAYEAQLGEYLYDYRGLVEKCWRVEEIVMSSRAASSLFFHNRQDGNEKVSRRGFSRRLTVVGAPPLLRSQPLGEGVWAYRFVPEDPSAFRGVLRGRGKSRIEALSGLATAKGVRLRFVGSERAETALDDTLAFAGLNENPLLGGVWEPLASELARVIHRLRKADFWRLDTLSPRVSYAREKSPYVQVMREDDGSYHVEVGPTDSLRMDDPKVPAMMQFMGWNLPESHGLPNFWQVFNPGTSPAQVITTALQTLVLMFDVGRGALFEYSGVGEEDFNRSGLLDVVPVANGRYVGKAVGLKGQHPFTSLSEVIAEASTKPPAELWETVTSALSVSSHARHDEPIYAAVVNPDDPRAVEDLIALVPPGSESGRPEAFRWTAGFWSEANSLLGAFLQGVPPSTVLLTGDKLLDVARQISFSSGTRRPETSGDRDWRWLNLPTEERLSKREVRRGTALLFSGLSMPEVAQRRQYSGTQKRELERAWLAAVERIRLDTTWYLALEKEWWWTHPQLALVRGLHDMDANSTLAWFDDPGVDQDYVKHLVLQYRPEGQAWQMVEPGTGGAWFPSAGDRMPVIGWPDPGENDPLANRNYRFLIPEQLAPGVDVRSRQEWGGPLANRREPTTIAEEPEVSAAPEVRATPLEVRVGVWEFTPEDPSKLARYLGEMRGEEHTPLESRLYVDPAVLAWADKFAERWVARDMREATGGDVLFLLNLIAGALGDQGLYTRILSQDESPSDMDIGLEY